MSKEEEQQARGGGGWVWPVNPLPLPEPLYLATSPPYHRPRRALSVGWVKDHSFIHSWPPYQVRVSPMEFSTPPSSMAVTFTHMDTLTGPPPYRCTYHDHHPPRQQNQTNTQSDHTHS